MRRREPGFAALYLGVLQPEEGKTNELFT